MKKSITKRILFIVIPITAIALIVIGYLIASLQNKESVTVSAASIQERLIKCSDLTTARLDYRGLIKYSEGEIKFITQKSFSMIYDAKITAGIDLSQADINISNNVIKVTLPHPEIQDIIIDSDSFEFYDEQLALFNWTEKEDTQKAMSYAKEDAAAKAEQVDLPGQARVQAESVISNLLLPFTESRENPYTLEVEFR